MIPEVILTETARDLEAWGLVEVSGGRMEKTKKGQICVDVWWATGKRGYWEFEVDQSWLLGEGAFGLNSLHERLADFDTDIETGEVLQLAEVIRRFSEIQSQITSEEEFEGKLYSVAYLIQRIAATGSEEANVSLAEIQKIFDSATSAWHVARIFEHSNQVLSKMADAAPSDDKVAALIERIAIEVGGFRQQALRSMSERQRTVRACQEVLLAAWLRGRKGLLLEIAESDQRALYVRCDSRVRDDAGGNGVSESIEDLNRSRFEEHGLWGWESP